MKPMPMKAWGSCEAYIIHGDLCGSVQGGEGKGRWELKGKAIPTTAFDLVVHSDSHDLEMQIWLLGGIVVSIYIYMCVCVYGLVPLNLFPPDAKSPRCELQELNAGTEASCQDSCGALDDLTEEQAQRVA